jgi:hypothetical protein
MIFTPSFNGRKKTLTRKFHEIITSFIQTGAPKR